jgi:hypothetical protein
MHCERRCGVAARAHHRLAALLPSACMRPVYLSEREPRALRACAAARCPHTRAAALLSAEARRAEYQKANRSTRHVDEHQKASEPENTQESTVVHRNCCRPGL